MSEPSASAPAVPTRRPLERFWPYVELAEAPSQEELAALDPELHAALFGARDLPFSFTLVFPDFDGDQFARALALAEAAPEYRVTGSGAARRHRARYFTADGRALRDLYALIGDRPESEVLIDDRPVPFARELWLPLLYLQLLD
ncbi:MAG: hypothetical protein R2745_14225 [Vicinamibacterales bacterium]